MALSADALPDDIDALKAALIAARTGRDEAVAACDQAEAELVAARAKASDDQAQIAHLKLQIAKLQRRLFGPHAERTRRLLDQLELELEEIGGQRHRGRDHRRDGRGQDVDGVGRKSASKGETPAKLTGVLRYSLVAGARDHVGTRSAER